MRSIDLGKVLTGVVVCSAAEVSVVFSLSNLSISNKKDSDSQVDFAGKVEIGVLIFVESCVRKDLISVFVVLNFGVETIRED